MNIVLRFVVLVSIALGTTLAHAQVIWNLATGYGERYFQTANIIQFADDVNAATANKLKIAVHPGGKLLRMPQIRTAVETGQVPMGEFIMSGEAKELPLMGLDSIPFLVGGYDDAELLWRLSRPTVEATLAQRGLRVLFAVPWPPQGLYSVKPIDSVRDMRGMLFRTYNPATERIAQLVDAKAVNVQLVDLPKALANGELTGMLTSATSGVEIKAWDYLKFYYDANAWLPKNIVVVNAKAFATLEPKVQEAVLAAAGRAEKRGWEMSRRQHQEDKAQLVAHGMKVNPPEWALTISFRRMSEQFSREWLRTSGNEALNVVLAFELEKMKNRQTDTALR